MARTIAPGTPTEPKALNIPQPKINVSFIDKMAENQIRAANTNFSLYADNAYKTQALAAYKQFESDPIQLSNALATIIDNTFSDLPQEISDKYRPKFMLNATGLVEKAENNRLYKIDQQNKAQTDAAIADIAKNRLSTYQLVLENHTLPAEAKRPLTTALYAEQQAQLKELSELRDHNGKYVYSASQRKAMLDDSDVQLKAAKKYIDTLVLNDDDDLSNTKEYYQEFLLAPERFMAENYMNRNTYDAVVKYAQNKLKNAGEDIKTMRFNQSVMDAVALQVEYAPAKMARLKEAGLLDKKFIDKLEKTTAKFNEIDPSKVESPVSMIELLDIINRWESIPSARTDAEKIATLEIGTETLNQIAEYGKQYGLSDSTIKSLRQAVANRELDTYYGDMISNMGELSTAVRIALAGDGWTGANTLWGDNNIPNTTNRKRAVQVSEAMKWGIDMGNELVKQGRSNEIPTLVDAEVQKRVARILTPEVNWAEADANPDYTVQIGGRWVKPKGYDKLGNVQFEIME